jgi:hypothetical protein
MERKMPSTSYPFSPTDTVDNDPFGISKISGFYGPGIWASWFLITLSSWRAFTRQLNPELNGFARVQLIYTNVAAIDLFRQINSDNPSFGPLAAAITTCYWGLLCILVLVLRYPGARSTVWVVLFGPILPCSALVSFFRYAYKVSGTPAAGLLDLVFPSENRSRIMSGLYLLLLVGTAISLLAAYNECAKLTQTDESFAAKLKVFVINGGTMVLIMMSMVSVGLCTILFVVLHTWAEIPSCTLIKPCTDQSIREWKQTSVLVYALVVCVYETGSGLVQSVRKAFDGSHE